MGLRVTKLIAYGIGGDYSAPMDSYDWEFSTMPGSKLGRATNSNANAAQQIAYCNTGTDD